MKVEQLKEIIDAQKQIIGQLRLLLNEVEKSGAFVGKSNLITLKQTTESVIGSAKAQAFDKIVSAI